MRLLNKSNTQSLFSILKENVPFSHTTVIYYGGTNEEGIDDTSEIELVVDNRDEFPELSDEDLHNAFKESNLDIWNNDLTGEESMEDIKIDDGKYWLLYKGKDPEDTKYHFIIDKNAFKESSLNEDVPLDYEEKKERLVPTGLTDDKAKDIISAVVGQMSDGIWENSPGMKRYWKFASGLDDKGNIVVYNGYERRDSYSGMDRYGVSKYKPHWSYSAFSQMDDNAIKRFFANKIKQIVKKEGLDWNRNNTEPCGYLDYGSGVTVRDAYRVYDKLLGRIDRITEGNIIWTSETTEDDYDKESLKSDQYQDYLDSFDGTIQPDSYEEWLESDWLYNYLYNEFNNENNEYTEWYDFIDNYPEETLKNYYKDYLDDIKEREPNKPKEFDSWFEDYMVDDSDDQWRFKEEDLKDNVIPMIDDQVNGAIFITGNYHSNYPDFKKSGPGGKIVTDGDDLINWLSNEDKVEFTNEDGQVGVSAYDHDGSIGGLLYTLPEDPHKILEIALSTGYYDESDYEDNEEIVDEFLQDLSYDNIEMRDIKKPELLVPIKNGFLIKESDESYFKGVKILDRLYNNQELEELWNKAFKKLVPKTGNAKTDIGEVLRCLSSLSHAYYQNGDIMSHLQYQPGYYHDALDLTKAVKNIGDTTLIELVDKMWNTRLESAYAKYMATFYEYFINNYIKDKDLNESVDTKYVYTNAESEDESDAKTMAEVQYKNEAPNLDFKVHKDGNMYYVDFIGSKKDITDYLKKLGWYTDEEINKNDLIKPLTESKKPKKEKKEDKRVVMQQGNVTCFKENDSTYYVFENESDNEVEYNNEDEAMKDFMERVGIDLNNEVTE